MRQAANKSSVMAALRFGVVVLFILPALAGCGFGSFGGKGGRAPFTEREFGVKASPRVTTSRFVPKGGGRYLVGQPYKVAGKWFKPKDDPHYDKTGAASWYGADFHGRRTANGEIFDQAALTAAHPTLPLPSYVRVTNLENGRSIVVRVNDRGPFLHGREIDVSRRTADMLDFSNKGTARVRVKYVGKAPLEGDDTRMLMASYNAPTQMERGRGNEVRVAMADVPQPVQPRLSPFHFGNRPVANAPAVVQHANVTVSPEGFNIVNSTGASGLGPLFYAPPGFDADKAGLAIDNAFAAAEAMATRPRDLLAWRDTVDEDARALRLELGVFADPQNSLRIAEEFALLGAVDEEPVTIGDRAATRLTLIGLKPGATREDAVELAHKLGLRDIILYK